MNSSADRTDGMRIGGAAMQSLLGHGEPLLRGDKMTTEQFKEMLRYVKVNKRKAAEDTLANYAERRTEQL